LLRENTRVATELATTHQDAQPVLEKMDDPLILQNMPLIIQC